MTDRLIEALLIERDQPEVVVALGVVLERVGQELERDDRTRKFALLVEIRGVLLDAARDIEPARGEAPEEVVVSTPFSDLLLR